VGARLRREDAVTQFARFVFVGGTSSVVYAVLFVALLGWGTQPANVAGAVASTVLANELHRRLTFHAGARVAWFTAQVEGGGLTLAGMGATSLALAGLSAWAGETHPTLQLLVIGGVTGAVGLVRFAALRWLFRPRPAGPVAGAVTVATVTPATVTPAAADDAALPGDAVVA
jgi:putative flippase GtrA